MMKVKHIVMTCLLLCSGVFSFAQPLTSTYTKEDSTTVCRLLEEAEKMSDKGQQMLWFARKFMGVPYVGKTLEVNKEEQLVVNLRQLDCTTYVETVLALTMCVQDDKRSFADYQRMLAHIRYMGNDITYPERLHYFTWWLHYNGEKKIIKEISEPNPPFTAVQTVNNFYMSAHPDQYPMLTGRLDFQENIAQTEHLFNGRKYSYIPQEEVNNTDLMRQTVRNGDIIAIVTSKEGLDIAHLGIAVWRTDGLHMMHASMLKKQVIEDPLLLKDYLMARKTHLGIRVARIM